MNDWHLWAEVDRLRAEADRLERKIIKREGIMLSWLDKFVDRHLAGFCAGMLLGMIVVLLRFTL